VATARKLDSWLVAATTSTTLFHLHQEVVEATLAGVQWVGDDSCGSMYW